MKVQVGPTGIWLRVAANIHRFDAGLAAALAGFFQERGGNVLDVGCGDGSYLRSLREAGIECDGYDGSPNTPAMTGGLCGVLDFSKPVQLDTRYDWVLSLEVGEHIPRELEPVFIDNLHACNTRGVVLSWAVPGQGGIGHANERSNEYVKDVFECLGYHNDVQAESLLRAAVTDCYWFRDTLMIFVKKNGE